MLTLHTLLGLGTRTSTTDTSQKVRRISKRIIRVKQRRIALSIIVERSVGRLFDVTTSSAGRSAGGEGLPTRRDAGPSAVFRVRRVVVVVGEVG